MRATQLICDFAVKFPDGTSFYDRAAEKFGLKGYSSATEPTLVIGCYNIRMLTWVTQIAMHSGMVIVYWAGTDAKLFATEGNDYWHERFRDPRIKHIAASHWIAEDLDKAGQKYKILPLNISPNTDIFPTPPGECVYMYGAGNPVYNGGNLYKEVKERIPFRVIETTAKTYARPMLLEAYKNSFIGLRFTEHDGLSETLVEMGLMGRRMIHNGDTPNSIHYTKDPDAIADLINQEYQLAQINYERIAKETADFINIKDDYLNSNYYD